MELTLQLYLQEGKWVMREIEVNDGNGGGLVGVERQMRLAAVYMAMSSNRQVPNHRLLLRSKL